MPKNAKYYILILIHFLVHNLTAQDNTQSSEPVLIISILEKIESSHNIIFNYKTGILEGINVNPLPKGLSLSQKIENLREQTNLIFKRVSKAIVTITKRRKICGYINDNLKQPLKSATISSASKYVVSDQNGYFEIELESIDNLLSIRHIGFKTIERSIKDFNLNQCDSINMVVQEEMINTILLKSYLIKGIDLEDDWSTLIDYSEFSLLPGLIEKDVLQTVQALPSILSSDETVSNLNIRGGSNDQNLILWDDIKMYQTGHFFGLISSFNPSMTQTATIINNGTDVSYTDGVSGTIHMKTDRKINSDF